MIRIAEVVYSTFPSDPRPRRESEALRDMGAHVDIFCLNENEKKRETLNNIRVFRTNLQKKREGKATYIIQYARFIIRMIFVLAFHHFQKRYQIIHVHNMPDILILSAIIPKIFGAKVILDLHDPMPELFMTKYHIERNSWIIKVLILLENISIKTADIVLTPNIAFKKLFVSRGCPENKIHIIMNSPQEEIFYTPQILKKSNDKKRNKNFIMMFHGLIAERSGLEDAIKALKIIKEKIPDIEFHIYGGGDCEENVKILVKDLKLCDYVKFYGEKNLETIAEKISEIDLGIIPNRLNPFTNINLPTRIFEYLCLHKPVIVSETSGIKDYFDNNSIFYFQPGNINSLSQKILEVYYNPIIAKEVTEKGFKIYQKYSWYGQRNYLIKITRDLINGH